MDLRQYTAKPYVVAAIWIAVFTLAGFWASYYGRLPFGVADRHFIVHLHAVVFTSWLGILIAQTVFVARGDLKRHMAFGRIGIWWGWALVVMGLVVTVYSFQRRLDESGFDIARDGLVFPLWDMILFAPLFGAAVAARKTPVRHKRLMLVAVSVMLVAPGSRLVRALDIYSEPLLMFLWVLPLLFAQGSDLMRQKGVSRIYVAAIALIPASFYARIAIGETEAWAGLARGLARLVG